MWSCDSGLRFKDLLRSCHLLQIYLFPVLSAESNLNTHPFSHNQVENIKNNSAPKKKLEAWSSYKTLVLCIFG